MREAHALKAAGRLDEAVRRYGEAVAANPRSGAAEHALAACLGEDGRWAEAEGHIREAFTKGLDTPETWLVKGRCELALGRLDGADMAFREALKRRGDLHAAVRELAQLAWMRTGDAKAALTALGPADGLSFNVVKAQVLEAAGDGEGAFALMAEASAAVPLQAGLAVQASQMAAQVGRAAEALALALRAQAEAAHELPVLIALAEALLCAGEAQKASDLIGDMRRTWSTNQHAIALQATAWRMLRDQRYRTLCDYDRMVGTEMLETPAGWASLEAYLADVGAALKPLHPFVAQPFGSPVRLGSQVGDIARQAHPALQALPRAIDGAMRRLLDRLGEGDDPARARNRGTYRVQGMTSVRLGAGGHVRDHVRPQGWLSAVCRVEAGAGSGLRFGRPGLRTHPMLAAEHAVTPKPGMLVLFPSYLWQGCETIGAGQTHLSLAFDVLPGPVLLPRDPL